MQHTLTRKQTTSAPDSASTKRGFVGNVAMIAGTIYAVAVTAMVGLEPELVTVTPFWVVSLIVMATVAVTYIAGHRSSPVSGQSRRMQKWITSRRTS